jgi:hypothetical protein
MKTDRFAYNRQVLAALRLLSPAHAEELNSRGTARGWWVLCDFYRTSRRSPLEAAREIAEEDLVEGPPPAA